MTRSFSRWFLVCLLSVGLGATASSQIPSAGAKSGWVYYGLLLSPGAGASEQWSDVGLSLPGAASGSKKPSKGAHLKCEGVVSIRQAPASAQGAGLPPIIGVVAAGSVVNVSDVVEVTVSRGTQYWVKIGG